MSENQVLCDCGLWHNRAFVCDWKIIRVLKYERDRLKDDLIAEKFECVKALKEIDRLKAELEEFKEKFDRYCREMIHLQDPLNNANKDRDIWKSKYEDFKSQADRLSCPICGSDVDGNNWKSRAEESDKQLDASVTLRKEAEQRQSVAESKAEKMAEALRKIPQVSQFGRENGPLVSSEHYEAAWLDCVEIAKEALAEFEKEV